MTAASIALNRFGLGARPGDTIAGDPHDWVVGQFDRFIVAPDPSRDFLRRPRSSHFSPKCRKHGKTFADKGRPPKPRR